ncbi:hypothetical protein [Salmonirosea aquatica]|uniref:Outer membrane beta-barrel protein n=1 Tax=Salmonirosea aquatica TaxID=2654236 RepID=A0A7C9BIJ5_9BACT|nr:hypothetical protein [Cytophagaceae bacterium SJW1-29]
MVPDNVRITSYLSVYNNQYDNSILSLPYGPKQGLSYGTCFQVQRVHQEHFIAGMSLGYENLRSRVPIEAVEGMVYYTSFNTPASGRAYLANHFINGFPYLGYRFDLGPMALDLTGGVDVGYLYFGRIVGRATTDEGKTYQVQRRYKTNSFDARTRYQLTLTRKRFGVYAGYSNGFVNYTPRSWTYGWKVERTRVKSNLIRFGILYKVKG